jgi:hypothetical protein
MESDEQKKLAEHAAESLVAGEVPFGSQSISIDENKDRWLQLLAGKITGGPREWQAGGEDWSRYTINSEVLWFPAHLAAVIFQGSQLAQVSFHDPARKASNWDYQIEVDNYRRTRKALVQYLGNPSEHNESNSQNLSAAWNYDRLGLSLSCDGKTGGCALSIRRR